MPKLYVFEAGRITGMYKPEQVMVRRIMCPYCQASNSDTSRFCSTCGAELALQAKFEVIRDPEEVTHDGAAEAPKAADR